MKTISYVIHVLLSLTTVVLAVIYKLQLPNWAIILLAATHTVHLVQIWNNSATKSIGNTNKIVVFIIFGTIANLLTIIGIGYLNLLKIGVVLLVINELYTLWINHKITFFKRNKALW